MDIIKVLEEVIPKINKETLKELEDLGHALQDKEPDELDKLTEDAFEKLGDIDTDEATSVMLFLIGKELGKQQAVKEQKIFIQGDY